MPKITESLWRNDLTEEQIQEAERKLQKWLDDLRAKNEQIDANVEKGT